MNDCEILISPKESVTATTMLNAMIQAATIPVTVGYEYTGSSKHLMLWGIGREGYPQIRARHLATGGTALLWDLGYFGRAKATGYCRVSVNHQHPQWLLDDTKPDPSRWDLHGLELSQDANPAGQILLIGMGRKSHAFLGTKGWEQRKQAELRQRFPGKPIALRIKPTRHDHALPIQQALKGVSLVVCRHSNVAVDACIAGVPFECEDGAAIWLQEKPYTAENRLDFLRRLAWWQWKATEAAQAWKFLLGATAR